jgi:hypothetical protein
LRTIYTDGSFCRSKLVAAFLDASFHLMALVLLARRVPAPEAFAFTALGLLAYGRVFTPGVQEKHA